ncbi:MAG: heme-binding protein [Acidobacteria bacterium]|nr:MAG: heme-binding protein [Acidobacteriota bacterium]
MAGVRIVRRLAIVFLILFVVAQFIRPARTNPRSQPSANLMTKAPREVAQIFDRSCRDCHSNDTRWPLYTQVAPMSWLVTYDVREGRDHFNYSEWTAIDPDDQDKLLGGVCTLAKRGRMPLWQYLLIHRGARLSPADVTTLCTWSEKMRDTIQ